MSLSPNTFLTFLRCLWLSAPCISEMADKYAASFFLKKEKKKEALLAADQYTFGPLGNTWLVYVKFT